jgi:hypothetical protein
MEHALEARDRGNDRGDNRGPHTDDYCDHDLIAPPSQFELSDEVGQAIYEFYVQQHISLRDAVRKARSKTGEAIKDKSASQFVRANGWMRSQQYYAKRSRFAALNDANFAETRAKREGRI